jgi:crotonobetaine/carnitine-CoA ligase
MTGAPAVAGAPGIAELLRERATLSPNAEYVRFTDAGSATFGETDAEVDRIAAWMQSHGVVAGDRVALMLPNRLELIVSWFAANRLGAIEVPLNIYLRGAALSHQVSRVAPRVIVTDKAGVAALQSSKDLTEGASILLVDNAGMSHDNSGWRAIETYRIAANHAPLPKEAARVGTAFEEAAIMFTSGTSGLPKGASATHYYMLEAAREWVRYTGSTSDDVLFNPLPLFHVNAQFLSALPPLITGSRVVFAPTFSASRFWSQVADHGVTQFNYHSSMLAILLRTWPDSLPAHQLRVGMGAGASASDWKEFEHRTGVPLVEAYGLTECVAVTAATVDERRPGSCGLATTGYEVAILDENDNRLPPDVVGQIAVRPARPFLGFEGYYMDPAATVASTRNLWFHTGDVGRIDVDGYLWFSDRRSDAIRRRGENISSHELETVVREFPGVIDCAAVGVSADLGENEVLVALETSTTEFDDSELQRYMYQRVPYFAVPRYIWRGGDLPRNASNRVLKGELKGASVVAEAWDGADHLNRLEEELGRR